MKQKIAKRFLFCILALLPFPIMALLTKLFFMDVYLPSWMYENKFAYMWVVIAIVGFIDYKWGFVLSGGNVILIIAGELIGRYMMIKNRALYPREVWYEHYWCDHNGFWIWADGMFYLAVAYGIFRIVRHIVKRKSATKIDKNL